MSVTEFELDGRGVATLTLNRPEVRNAFNGEMIEELVERVTDLPEGTRVLVLKGAGKVFCAGADLDWMRSMAGSSMDANTSDSATLQRMFSALDNCSVPVVARIHGAAMAGATGLVACCDIAIAEEPAVFAFTEVRIGLIPAVISPYVTRRVGYSFARSAFMTAERFDAKRAAAVGLIHRVVPSDRLDSAVDEAATELLQAAPGAVIAARDLVREVWGKSPEDAAAYTINAIAQRRVSEEGLEGVMSFLQKRKPAWFPADEGPQAPAGKDA